MTQITIEAAPRPFGDCHHTPFTKFIDHVCDVANPT
jgi:hypothetical protein